MDNEDMVVTSILYILICLWILPNLIPKNHWLRFYVCYLAFITYCLTTSIILIPTVIFLPITYCKRFAILLATLITKLIGIEWEVRNTKIMENGGKGVIVANHQSIFDMLGLLLVSQVFGNVIVVSRKEIFYIWPLGLLCHLIGCIFVDRANSEAAVLSLKLAAEAHLSRLDHTTQIIIFPEGTRNKNGNGLLPFKKGAFRIAIDHHVPIFPIVFSSYYFIEAKKLFTQGKVIITFLEPIPTQNLKPENVDKLLQETRTLMENEYKNLQKEIFKFKI